MEKKVTDYINQIVNSKKIPYIDVLVKKKHEIVYRNMQGYDYSPSGKELLYLYSLTKPVTAVCVMQLIEKGLLFLDDDVGKFLPEYYNAYLSSTTCKKIKVNNTIKIKHLLTMSAGLTYDRETNYIKELKEKTQNKATTREMVKTFVESPLVFEPGSDFLYSLCFDVLGAVVEVVSKKNFSDYVEENIFKPLNMLNSTFDDLKNKNNILQCYEYKNGLFEKEDLFYLMKLSENYDSAGGGIIGTVEDYSNFADALACNGVGFNGNQILSKPNLDLMASEQISKLSVNNTFTCVQGDDYGYGYGVRVRKTASANNIPKGEFGWDGATGSYLLVDRVNEVSIVIGMNILNWPNVFKGEHLKLSNLIYKEIIKA